MAGTVCQGRAVIAQDSGQLVPFTCSQYVEINDADILYAFSFLYHRDPSPRNSATHIQGCSSISAKLLGYILTGIHRGVPIVTLKSVNLTTKAKHHSPKL